MRGKTILEIVVGSTVHGTSVSDGLEDLDLMSVVVENTSDVLGFSPSEVKVHRSKPEGVRSEAGDIDHVAYGLRKFLGLALKGNPSILLALFVPESFTRNCTIEGHQLRALAPKIVSKRCYKPFCGYMTQQYLRLVGTRGQKRCTRPELVDAYGFDTKYAAHIVRLGLQGAELLRTGSLTLPMPATDRELVRRIRQGAYSLDGVTGEIESAKYQLDFAYKQSPLREEPDVESVERWMIDTYLGVWL